MKIEKKILFLNQFFKIVFQNSFEKSTVQHVVGYFQADSKKLVYWPIPTLISHIRSSFESDLVYYDLSKSGNFARLLKITYKQKMLHVIRAMVQTGPSRVQTDSAVTTCRLHMRQPRQLPR